MGEIEPRWKVEPVEGEVDVVPGERKLPVPVEFTVPRVAGPRLPRGTAPPLVAAPPTSGAVLRYVERFEKLLLGVVVVEDLGETADGERGAADPEETRPEGAENLDVDPDPVLGVALYVEGALER